MATFFCVDVIRKQKPTLRKVSDRYLDLLDLFLVPISQFIKQCLTPPKLVIHTTENHKKMQHKFQVERKVERRNSYAMKLEMGGKAVENYHSCASASIWKQKQLKIMGISHLALKWAGGPSA